MPGQQGHNTRLEAQLPPSFLGMNDHTTERSFGSQAMWFIDVLRFFYMLSVGFCTTSQWQTSGRLVQELNVCTLCLCASM